MWKANQKRYVYFENCLGGITRERRSATMEQGNMVCGIFVKSKHRLLAGLVRSATYPGQVIVIEMENPAIIDPL